MPSLTERNKDTIPRLLREVDEGRLGVVVDESYAPDYIDHAPSPGRRLGPRRDRAVRRALCSGKFPDTCHVIEDLVAEGDKVVARISAKATHTRPLLGSPPTEKMVCHTSIAIYRLVDPRILERWADQGPGVLEQLGITIEDP